MPKFATHADMVAGLAKAGQEILDDMDRVQMHRLHMAVGIAGEAGELLDAIKKVAIYQKEIDRDNVIEELGDLEFYMEGLRASLGITREQTIEANMYKLAHGKNARYSEGYSNTAAQVRADKQ